MKSPKKWLREWLGVTELETMFADFAHFYGMEKIIQDGRVGTLEPSGIDPEQTNILAERIKKGYES